MEEKDKGINTKMPSSPPFIDILRKRADSRKGEKGEGWRERARDRVSVASEDISGRRSQGGHIYSLQSYGGKTTI